MTHMVPWQRVLYFLGEAVMIGGLIWGLIARFALRVCPTGPLNYLTLIVAGLGLSVVPLLPFGAARHLSPVLRRAPAAAVIWWVLALIGVGYALWDRATLQPGVWWFAALVPGLLYFWFGVQTRVDDGLKPPRRAPKAPPPGQETERPEPDSGGETDSRDDAEGERDA